MPVSDEAVRTLTDAVQRQTEALARMHNELSKFATHADLDDRVMRQEEIAKRARWRTRLVISVIAVVLAGAAYWKSSSAVHRVCVAENSLIGKDRQIIDLATEPLPVNPAAPVSVQQQITDRNAASAAFRVQLESGVLQPLSCSSSL